MASMKANFVSFLCATIVYVMTTDGGIAGDVLLPPVSATFISKHEAKPPTKFIRAALVLTNRSKTDLWFVLPYRCDEPPKLNNPLRTPEGFQPAWISASGFNTGAYNKVAEGSKGRTIRLTV